MLDFPNHPGIGQVFGAVGLSWTWDGVKWTSVPTNLTGTSPADFNVLDFGAAGDGGTDDTRDIQTAIDAAAGHGRVRFPGTLASGRAAVYLTGTLYIPSNTHLIIEAGATLKLAPGAGGMLIITDDPVPVPHIGASNVYIELRGTLDGNASSVPPPGFPSGGIVNLGVCSDIYVDGFRQGLVTNFAQWPVNLTRCTNAEVRNLAMTNSGSSCEFAGTTSGGVTTNCYNVGFTKCYVQDIRDLGLVLYGGCISSYIRGCVLNNASAIIFQDHAQVGTNTDCEISGCYRYNGIGAIGTASNAATGPNNQNCRIFNNTIENVHDAGITIGAVDYCDVYGNLVHDTGVNFSTTSGQCGQVTIAGSTHVNCYGNTVRNPTAPGYWQAYASSTVASATYNPTTGAVSITTAATHTINVGDQFIINSAFGNGAYLSLNGTWTATAGTTNDNGPPNHLAVVNFTGPTGLTLTLTKGNVRKYTPAVPAAITSGTYDPATGNVVLTTSAPHGLTFSSTPQPFVVSGITGTGPVANLDGYQVATAGTSGTTINCRIATGFAAMSFSGGTILPANFGISVYDTDYCRVTNNFVGDWQATKNMAACIGGQWGAAGAPGTDGYTEGNVYGPKLASGPLYSFPADAMVYVPASGCTQGVSYDSALDFYCGTTAGRNIGGETFFPGRGLTVGWNVGPGGTGEVDLLCGRGAGAPGGFNFRQVTNDGTINANVGVAGSLLANDGYGNTRLGGALVHGAMQTWGTLANAGVVTVNANTSRVLIRNAASIATASVILPAPVLNAFTAGTDLELNFQNPIGALAVTAASGASVVNPPTTITQAGASVSFINSGTTWLRRIAT